MNIFVRFWRWLRRPNKSTIEQWLETIIIIVPIAFVIRTYIYGLYVVPTGSMETTMLVGEAFFADKFTLLFSSLKHGDIISFNDPNYAYSSNTFVKLFENYVWGPQNWTKRVIGIPGDHVKGVLEQGKPVVYLNGKKLDEPYINKYPLMAVYLPEQQTYTFRSYDPAYSYRDQPFYRLDKEYVDLGERLAQRYREEPIREPYTTRFNHYGNSIDEYDIHLGSDEYWVMGDNRLGSYDCRMWGGTGRPLKKQFIHGKIVFRIFSIDTSETWMILDLLKHPIDFWTRIRWSRFLQIVR